MPKPTLNDQLIADMTEAILHHPGVDFHIGPSEALCVVSALQLALRYPGYADRRSRAVVEDFARALASRLATEGPLAAALEMGWHPEFDETDEQSADPEHAEKVAAQVFAAAERDGAQADAEFRSPSHFRIESLCAYVAIDPDDAEGVTAFATADGWMPMVMADERRIRSLRPIAVDLAAQTGRPITLVRFSQREDLEVIP